MMFFFPVLGKFNFFSRKLCRNFLSNDLSFCYKCLEHWDFESGTILDRCDHHDAAEEAFVMHGHGRGNAYTANIPRISPVFMFPHFWSERNNGTDFIDWRRRI